MVKKTYYRNDYLQYLINKGLKTLAEKTTDDILQPYINTSKNVEIEGRSLSLQSNLY